MAAEVNTSASNFEVGEVKPLFPVRSSSVNPRYYYDVAADGRFLFVSSEDGATMRPLTLVVNWVAGLKQ
jgi:hypothetical protein